MSKNKLYVEHSREDRYYLVSLIRDRRAKFRTIYGCATDLLVVEDTPAVREVLKDQGIEYRTTLLPTQVVEFLASLPELKGSKARVKRAEAIRLSALKYWTLGESISWLRWKFSKTTEEWLELGRVANK